MYRKLIQSLQKANKIILLWKEKKKSKYYSRIW